MMEERARRRNTLDPNGISGPGRYLPARRIGPLRGDFDGAAVVGSLAHF
jgi:hypothetical protein